MADADSYNSTIVSDWNISKPADTDSIGDVGKAIRQIKETIVKVDETGVSGLTKFLEGTLEKFIVDKITERFQYFYRVGDIICTRSKDDPAEIFGGTWQLLQHGTFLRASTLNPEEPLGTTAEDLKVVYSQYNGVKIAGSRVATGGDNVGDDNYIVYESTDSTYNKKLVKSPEKGYWLYTTSNKWSTNQNENEAVDYLEVYMWMKIEEHKE